MAISEMLGVSTDYLLKESVEGYQEQRMAQGRQQGSFHYEYKSKKTFMGMPLVHVNIGLRPVRAKGVIAIGNAAQGMIAIGIVGLGIITLAPVGVGFLFALGACVVGGIAFGSLAVGVIAGGAISVGIFTMGALAVGQFSFGALAVGQQVAIGDSAHGNIALGFSEAVGSIYEEVQAADGSFDHQAMIAAIDANVPDCFHIFANWMKAIIRAMA